MIQGDFNVYPEFFDNPVISERVKTHNPFKMYKDFSLIRTGHATELKGDSKILPERELDFAMVSPELKGRVSVVFHEEDQERALITKHTTEQEGKQKIDIHFDPMLLFSDHIPFEMYIRTKEES